jgi:hypothetical protein
MDQQVICNSIFYEGCNGLVRLAGSQPASSAFLSHQFSTSQQPPASQQYFSLTTNQHQPPATSQPNEANECLLLQMNIYIYIDIFYRLFRKM